MKPSPSIVGPDANNEFAFTSTGITGRNVTLRRLAAEAFHLQLNQVLGPKWLDENEYDVQGISDRPSTPELLARMLFRLLAQRFKLAQHPETRELRAYELVIDKGGPKVQPAKNGEPPAAGPGFRFHGNMRQFADLLAVQLSILIPDDPSRPGIASGPPDPVLDMTGLPGIFDFMVDIRLEAGTDGFVTWQRTLQEKMGLRLTSRKRAVDVIVIDSAEKIPTAN